MKDKNATFACRKLNLQRLVLDRFKGNKAAFARASGIHPNHVNLLLSENPDHARNMGEVLAGKIESALDLPTRWLDTPRDLISGGIPVGISAAPIPPSVSAALRSSQEIESFTVLQPKTEVLGRGFTSVRNLMLATVATNDMAPDICAGDTVVVDTGAKSITTDGVYIVIKSSAMLRRFGHSVTGEATISQPQTKPTTITQSYVDGLSVFGRVTAVIKVQPH
jgi:hypothetical protein